MIFSGMMLTQCLKKIKKMRRECDKYDPRTGEHVFTYKPLTAKQKRLVDEMRRVDPQETYVSAYTKLGIKFR